GPCGSDYRSIENMSLVAKSSFHLGNRASRLLLNDWELAPLMHISSGGPINVTSGSDISLTAIGNDRPNLVAGVDPYHEVSFRSVKSQANREYLNPDAFAAPATPGTFGNISRNAFRDPKSFTLDTQ